MKKIEACIFDMDGVIVDSAKYHYLSWKRLTDQMGFEFSEQHNERLKGVSRKKSLEIILEIGGISLSEEEKDDLCIKKNDWFNDYVDTMTPAEILPGVLEFFKDLKINNIKIALGSASRNANKILNKIGMIDMFDAIVDGTHVQNAKPDPEIFLTGAKLLNISPVNCVVFEDAEAGVQAAKSGGMYCVGVGDSSILSDADFCIDNFTEFKYQILENKLQ